MRQTRRPTLILVCAALLAAPSLGQPPPTELPGLEYDLKLFPGTDYDPALPTPESCLGFRPGDRAAFPHEIEACLEAWAATSERVQLEEYARSHEGRALYTVVLTSPRNHARLDQIRGGWARLADPRGGSEAELSRLLDELPAVAWIAYSIHGDETSGSDASLAVIHHLAAGRGPQIEQLLDELVVVIDPMQNPDGRHRFLQMIAEHRGSQPNVDDQSLIHGGYWPWGRTNHYGFDLNRDWVLGVNPETRGRIRAAGGWHPVLVVDAHEMGSQDTYLFSPPREPRSPFTSAGALEWGPVFARDQARAFDQRGWVYYTGEWNEGWYAGYTDAWGELRGVVGILYEQAGFAEDGVRRPEGTIHTYREAVHHQAVSSLANLETLRLNAGAIKKAFLTDRLAAVAADGRYAERTWAVLPTANRGRLQRFVDLMRLQGIELHTLDEPVSVGAARDQLGRRRTRVTVPAGSLLIANRQPLARLTAAMLEFDPRMPDDYLRRERRELLRTGQTSIYDVTAWNLTMMHGLPALSLEGALPAAARPLPEAGRGAAPEPSATGAVAWIVDGADDRSVAVAARLMERGVETRVADRALELDGAAFPRGSLVVLPIDNRRFQGDLAGTVAATAAELGLAAVGAGTGLGEGDLPDLGGGHFRRLEPPAIGLFTRGGLSVYDFGSIWHALDRRLGVRHSHLDLDATLPDLRRYNVLILPDRWYGALPEAARTALAAWVEAGGTLIAVGRSAAELANEEAGLSAVRLLRDVQADLDRYEQAVLREHQAARREIPSPGAIWSHLARGAVAFPWAVEPAPERPPLEERERRDRWRRLFMPQGAILAARTDDEHWLTYGSEAWLPLLYGGPHVLMTDGEAPVRLGVLRPAGEGTGVVVEGGTEAKRVGWALLPAGEELRLRMSGLLWPEAAERLAHGAAVTRERKGRGQVILFAVPATFRGSTLASERLLLNAVVYGPGLGASAPIRP